MLSVKANGRAFHGSSSDFTQQQFLRVSIPVELYPATQSKAVHFKLLHKQDNSRIQEKIYCVAEGRYVDRNELVHEFQISKG
jgi:non-homologous end joining protein Ku